MEFYILVGNVGTGKTTYRKERFINGEVIICPDEWKGLTENEVNDKIFSEIKRAISAKQSLVVDGNNIRRRLRKLYFQQDIDHQYRRIIIDFGPGNHQSLARRVESSDELSEEGWRRAHDNNRRYYQKPQMDDDADEIIDLSSDHL